MTDERPTRSIYIASPEGETGKSTIALGILHRLTAKVPRVGVFRPIARREDTDYILELLLAQSSDWSFILRAGTTTELARERIHRHLDRFWRLLDAIETGTSPSPAWLEAVQREDGLFPLLNAADWATPPAR